VAKPWSPPRNNAPNIKKESEESYNSWVSDLRDSWDDDPKVVGVMTLGTVGMATPKAVGVMILEAARVVTQEVDGVLTPKLTGEPILTNGKVTQTIVGRTNAWVMEEMAISVMAKIIRAMTPMKNHQDFEFYHLNG